jgi:hypothetical protein
MKMRLADQKAQINTKVAHELQKLKKNNIIAPSASKFYPADHSAHHLPPNEEEDCGLELIARFMLDGQPEITNLDGRRSSQATTQLAHSPTSQTTLSSNKKHQSLKPYELINLIGGGGVNLQFVNADLVKQYLFRNQIIKDVHMIQRVVDRLKSKKKWLPSDMISVKKFDVVLRPYLTRVSKYPELQVQLGHLKKNIFQRDMTVAEFFQMCRRIGSNESAKGGYFNTSSSPGGYANRPNSE